ncbi:MAG: hypothetical protein O2890_14030 [Cyanobacteria bacterium]|nr:hypothetical protein [Cyanobacteriota bacterium]
MQSTPLQPSRHLPRYGTAPEAPRCDVDYRKHQKGLSRSLSYMEKLLGEG